MVTLLDEVTVAYLTPSCHLHWGYDSSTEENRSELMTNAMEMPFVVAVVLLPTLDLLRGKTPYMKTSWQLISQAQVTWLYSLWPKLLRADTTT